MDTTTTFTFRLLYPRVNGIHDQGSRLGNSTANLGLKALSTVPASAGTRTAIFYSGFTLPKISRLLSIIYPHMYKKFC